MLPSMRNWGPWFPLAIFTLNKGIDHWVRGYIWSNSGKKLKHNRSKTHGHTNSLFPRTILDWNYFLSSTARTSKTQGLLSLTARTPKPWHFDENKGRDWLRSHNLITLAPKTMALVFMALSGSSPWKGSWQHSSEWSTTSSFYPAFNQSLNKSFIFTSIHCTEWVFILCAWATVATIKTVIAQCIYIAATYSQTWMETQNPLKYLLASCKLTH